MAKLARPDNREKRKLLQPASKTDFSVGETLLLGRRVQGCSPSPSKKKRKKRKIWKNFMATSYLQILSSL